MNPFKLSLVASAAVAALSLAPAQAADPIKVGILFGFTGPIETLTPPMADGAELALSEVNASGKLLDGASIEAIRADSTCVDNAAATAAAERLITSDGIVALVGADCSGVTGAVVSNVAVANGLPVISPSATSPALTGIEDNGLFFRVVPSDARQGQVLADVLLGRGIESVAVTYTNNDYGKGLSDSFSGAYEANGGKVVINIAHEDGKGDYTAEVASLAAGGADHLVVLGYADQGGKGILQASIDTDAFGSYSGADGMVADSVMDNFGDAVEGMVVTLPGAEFEGSDKFGAAAEAAGITGSGPFIGESYDAAALLALAMQKAGKADRAAIAGAIADVANAPGEKIYAGELGKALEIIAGGGDVDYVGATDVELNDSGETQGAYKEQIIENGAYKLIKFH